MPVSEGVAYKLAIQLALIPECPQGDRSLEILAEELERLCADDDEAGAIVTQARDSWERWRGPRGLIELIHERRTPPLPPANQAIDLGPKPAVDCARCGDWGYFSTPDGTVVWCDCDAGKETRERMPGLVDSLKRKQVKPLHEPAAIARPPITQADIDQAFEQRQDRTEEMIREQRAILDDPSSSADRKEIARAILAGFGK